MTTNPFDELLGHAYYIVHPDLNCFIPRTPGIPVNHQVIMGDTTSELPTCGRTRSEPVKFGRALRDSEFLFDPSYRNLNHGSSISRSLLLLLARLQTIDLLTPWQAHLALSPPTSAT